MGDLLISVSPVIIGSFVAYKITHQYQKNKDNSQIKKEIMKAITNGFLALYKYAFVSIGKEEFDDELRELKLEVNQKTMEMETVLLSYLPEKEINGHLHKLFIEFDEIANEVITKLPDGSIPSKVNFDKVTINWSKLRNKIIKSIRLLEL